MFKSDDYTFKWADMGDIELGRPNLGNQTSVAVYRLMQYSMRSIINKEYGGSVGAEIYYKAGRLAGEEFCKNMLDCSLPFNEFIAKTQELLIKLGVGNLKIEKANLEMQELVIVVTEDLDCSGLPVTDETVCDYDEGFLAGILFVYTGKEFNVREVDCWANGDRVCRFVAKANL